MGGPSTVPVTLDCPSEYCMQSEPEQKALSLESLLVSDVPPRDSCSGTVQGPRCPEVHNAGSVDSLASVTSEGPSTVPVTLDCPSEHCMQGKLKQRASTRQSS